MKNVLLVAADPVGLTGVSWQDIKDTIERVYNAHLGGSKLEMPTIEGADPLELLTELQTRQFDIVHFSCHGDVKDGMGRLMLVNSQTRRTAFITADELGRTLAGRDIRLVILSACDTSTPTGADFGSTAETLIAQGTRRWLQIRPPFRMPPWRHSSEPCIRNCAAPATSIKR